VSGFATVRRVGWGVGDQAISSLTNFFMLILVARTVSQDDFGAFSLAFAAYVLTLVVSRGLTGEPLVVRHSHTVVAEWRAATAGSAGLALAFALAAAVASVVLAAIVGGRLSEAFLALAIVLPGLLVQDVYRYAFVAHGVPVHAFICDAIWAAILLPVLILLGGGPDISLALPILVWGASALISAVVGMALGRVLPSLRRARAWFVESRDLGLRFATEALISQAPFQVTLFVLGSVAGLAAIASLRGAQVLLGPISMLIIGLSIVGVPEGVRLSRSRGVRGVRTPAALLAIGTASFTLVWGLALTLLPADVGEKLLGDSWAGASDVLVPVTFAWVGNALAFGATVGLRVLADSRRSLRARSADASAQTIGGVVGAFIGAAFGAAFGWAVGMAVGAVAWWLAFNAAIAAHVAAGGRSDDPTMPEGEPHAMPTLEPEPGVGSVPGLSDPWITPDDPVASRQSGARTHHPVDP
jgi:O-antigen/teichoic acid export membrane protein